MQFFQSQQTYSWPDKHFGLTQPAIHFYVWFGFFQISEGFLFNSINCLKIDLVRYNFFWKIKLITLGKNSRRWRRAVIFPSCRSNFCRMVHNWISCSICCRTAKGKKKVKIHYVGNVGDSKAYIDFIFIKVQLMNTKFYLFVNNIQGIPQKMFL